MILMIEGAERQDEELPPSPPRTVVTATPDMPERPEPRQIRGATFARRYDVLGAAAGAIAIATLLFGWLTPLSGFVGWVLISFLCFIGLYVLLAKLGSDWQDVADRIVTVLMVSAGVVLFGALAFVVVYTVVRGLPALLHLNFFWQTMQLAGPLDPLDVGGISQAIVGTLIQISIALAITIPLGLTTAVFLNEVGGRFARFVRTITDAMTALPSIVAGLFVYAAVVQLITNQRNGFAAAIAITVMMLPIMVRAADVVLRLVPQNLREASYALGSTRWRTVWKVVLPTSRSGLVTAIILATARGIGETSPVLLTSGITSVLNGNPFEGPMISLPLQVFDLVKSPEPNMIARGFGTAAVLLLLVLLLFTLARAIGGRGPGEMSYGRRRRLALASQGDLRRIQARDAKAERAKADRERAEQAMAEAARTAAEAALAAVPPPTIAERKAAERRAAEREATEGIEPNPGAQA